MWFECPNTALKKLKVAYNNSLRRFTPVSDHLMQFCIVKGRQGRNINNFPKCMEVENINPLSINNFKHAILKSNIYEKLAKNPDSDPNQNYEIFSSALTEAKTNHIPKNSAF